MPGRISLTGMMSARDVTPSALARRSPSGRGKSAPTNAAESSSVEILKVKPVYSTLSPRATRLFRPKGRKTASYTYIDSV